MKDKPPPVYTWQNTETGEIVELFNVISERDMAPDGSGKWTRLLQMPAFKKVTYLDGQRKKSDSSYQKLARMSKLEVDKAESMSKDEKKGIQKEIDTLSKVH